MLSNPVKFDITSLGDEGMGRVEEGGGREECSYNAKNEKSIYGDDNILSRDLEEKGNIIPMRDDTGCPGSRNGRVEGFTTSLKRTT